MNRVRRDPPVSHSPASPDDPPDPVLALEEVEATIDEAGTIRSGKLAGKSMWAAMWIVALPVLLQQFLGALVGLVDKLIAGSLPAEIVVPALDGIGIGSYVGWFISIAMTGLGVGAQAIISRGMGGGRREESERALGQSMTFAVAWGALVGGLMWIAAEPLARVADLTPAAIDCCRTYVRTIAISMPFCGLMMVGGMAMHGAGEATRPALIALGVNAINVLFSWLLSGVDLRLFGTTVLHPFDLDPGRSGVFGIAAGTAISYAFGGLATTWVLLRGVKDLRLKRADLAPDGVMGRRIVRIGIPNFLEGLAMWGVQLFVMLFIGISGRGEAGGLLGAHTICVQWEAFSFLPGFAMGTAAGTLAGQFLGAGNPRLARRAIWACTLVGMAIMGSCGLVFMLAGERLTAFISLEPVHLETVPRLLFACGSVQVFFALAMVVRNGLRGVGDTTWILWITVASCYGLRLPLAWYLGVHLGHGLVGIWWALSAELVVRGLLFLLRFLFGRWDRIAV